MKIYYNNIKCCSLKNKIKKLFESAYKTLNSEIEVDVGVTFVCEEEIKELNFQHRKIDKKTDVLSFPMLELYKHRIEEYKEEFLSLSKTVSLGDIVICKKIAKQQAKEYGHSLKRELCFLALHGFLHLIGYDHIEKEDEVQMQALAEKILVENSLGRNK